jgi:hypothetical protein
MCSFLCFCFTNCEIEISNLENMKSFNDKTLRDIRNFI